MTCRRALSAPTLSELAPPCPLSRRDVSLPSGSTSWPKASGTEFTVSKYKASRIESYYCSIAFGFLKPNHSVLQQLYRYIASYAPACQMSSAVEGSGVVDSGTLRLTMRLCNIDTFPCSGVRLETAQKLVDALNGMLLYAYTSYQLPLFSS